MSKKDLKIITINTKGIDKANNDTTWEYTSLVFSYTDFRKRRRLQCFSFAKVCQISFVLKDEVFLFCRMRFDTSNFNISEGTNY